MKAGSRTIAFGALALVLVIAAVVLILGGDSGPAPSTTVAEEPRPEAHRYAQPARAASPRGAADRELVLPDRGSPIVWVRRGHRVTLHGAPGGPPVERLGEETEFGSRTILSVFETRGEWAGVPNPHTGNGTLGWVRLDGRHLRAGYTLREIVVDLSERRAQLLIEGDVVRTFTVTIGAPGTTTPTGRFAVTDTFRGGLNRAYGCCAVALTAEQPNLPSGWLGGSRIAIHGTSGPLGDAISSGCVRAADRDVSALVDEAPPGAPVLVRQ